MKRISKSLLGLAAGAVALAFMAGITPTSAGFLTLNPAGSNGPANLVPDSGAGTFSTDGGTGWAAFGAVVQDNGNHNSGTASYSLRGAVDIDHFSNTSFTSGTGTCVGNDSSGCGWTFFATVHIAGSGSWNNGVYTASSAPTVELDLWALQGNVTNFGGANVTSSVNSLTDFFSLGLTGNGNIECYTSGGNVGTGGSDNCVQVAHSSGTLAGTAVSIDDTGNGNSPNSITFNISTIFDTETYATGAPGKFWVQPPDPSTFGLVVLSGCEASTSNTIATPIGLRDGTTTTSSFFQTDSQQSGAAPCNPNAGGQATNHDPVGWAFATAVPEPTSLAILGSALLGFGLLRRRRNS